MKKLIAIGVLFLLLGCGSVDKDAYVLFKYNDFEIFRSHSVDRIFITDSRVYVNLNSEDREVLEALGEVFDEPIMVDVYVGKSFYTSALINFGEEFASSGPISLPEDNERISVFQEVGISIKK